MSTGFAGRAEDDEIEEPIIKKNSSCAIAPPPSLIQDSSCSTNSSGIGVAAKIMAKYGFKEGKKNKDMKLDFFS